MFYKFTIIVTIALQKSSEWYTLKKEFVQVQFLSRGSIGRNTTWRQTRQRPAQQQVVVALAALAQSVQIGFLMGAGWPVYGRARAEDEPA
jgi:hypothetical protein